MNIKKLLMPFIWGLISLSTSTFSEPIDIKPKLVLQKDYHEFSVRVDTVVIDVRTPQEFNVGHLPGAINIPHRDILSAKVSLEKYANKQVLFYCHTGVRVGLVIDYLKRHPSLEKNKIYHLKGDYRAWQARGLAIVKPLE